MFGFFRQLINLMGLLSVIFFAPLLSTWLKTKSGWNWFQTNPEIVSFIISSAFIVMVFLCIQGLVVFAKKGVPMISGPDRWLGGALGTVKGIIVVIVLGMIFMSIPEKNRARMVKLDRAVEDSAFLSVSEGILGWKALPGARKLKEARDSMNEKDIFDSINLERDDVRKVPQPWASESGIDEN